MAETLYEQKHLDKALGKSAPNVVIASFGSQKILPDPFLQPGMFITKRQLAVYNRL